MYEQGKNKKESAPPLTKGEIQELLKPRDRLDNNTTLPIELKVMLSGDMAPKVETSLNKVESIQAVSQDLNVFEMKFTIQNSTIGVRNFPPLVPIKKVAFQSEQKTVQTDAYVPDHLSFRPIPDPLTDRLNIGTVFSPDERKVYNDTSYPWSTIGRVETPNGIASGVMVGPRHLLTVNHIVKWNSDGNADFLKFIPAYYDGSTTAFGQAYATTIYVPEGIIVNESDGLSDSEMRHDFVVAVLDTKIGGRTGWMGTKSWSNSWNDKPYWVHSGYPLDLTSCQKPIYQIDISLKSDNNAQHALFEHKADIDRGQSGGPFFGYWESKPHVVAIQSSQVSSTNYACGSEHMNQVIQKALTEYP